ncbi:hypothetical protein ACH4SK_12015 [Streptomyces inhibens]|uniref:hypothetical protein n=1 Tax=Streptomyces inhibens TaxID=2293571 RepID=UPI0037B6B9CD
MLDSAAYSVTADPAAPPPYDVAVITVPTPLRNGVPDLAYVETCAQTLGEHLHPGAAVVLESMPYPGTTEEVVLPILEKVSGLIAGSDFHVGFSPERIDPGNKAWPFGPTVSYFNRRRVYGFIRPFDHRHRQARHVTRNRTPV